VVRAPAMSLLHGLSAPKLPSVRPRQKFLCQLPLGRETGVFQAPREPLVTPPMTTWLLHVRDSGRTSCLLDGESACDTKEGNSSKDCVAGEMNEDDGNGGDGLDHGNICIVSAAVGW
jgi:hypothetical protein